MDASTLDYVVSFRRPSPQPEFVLSHFHESGLFVVHHDFLADNISDIACSRPPELHHDLGSQPKTALWLPLNVESELTGVEQRIDYRRIAAKILRLPKRDRLHRLLVDFQPEHVGP